MTFTTCAKCGQPREKRRCKTCAAEYQRAYRAQRDPDRMREYRKQSAEKQRADPEWRAARAAKVQAYKLMTKYGLTVEQLDTMLAEQGNACAICRRDFDGLGYGRACVDHDHVTGKVRGVLCVGCNTALGKFQDDPALLGRAIDYLKEHSQ